MGIWISLALHAGALFALYAGPALPEALVGGHGVEVCLRTPLEARDPQAEELEHAQPEAEAPLQRPSPRPAGEEALPEVDDVSVDEWLEPVPEPELRAPLELALPTLDAPRKRRAALPITDLPPSEPAAVPTRTPTLPPPPRQRPATPPVISPQGRATAGAPPPATAQGTPAAVRVLFAPDPAAYYPLEGRRQGWQGEVVLRVEIDAQGRVSAVQVARSSGFPELDDAALRYGAAMRFTTGAASRALHVPVRFELMPATRDWRNG